MFLIDAIKHNVEKQFKTCFIFLHDCLGEVSRKIRVMFSGGNKKIIQNKRERDLFNLSTTKEWK